MSAERKEAMQKSVDSYRFLDGLSRKLIRSWTKLEQPREIPWTPLSKPLRECTVALVSSGGIALRTDRPFDQEGERRNPWWGDPSFRIIPRGTRSEDIRAYHLHIDPSSAEEDLNCLLPIDRLDDLVRSGKVGHSSEKHYSYMGYLLDPRELLTTSIPAIIKDLRKDAVDIAVLVPA